jgi:hypothetical protein
MHLVAGERLLQSGSESESRYVTLGYYGRAHHNDDPRATGFTNREQDGRAVIEAVCYRAGGQTDE